MLNLQLTELSAVGTEYTQNLPLGTIIGSLFLFELVSIVPGFTTYSGSENGTFNISTVTNLLPQAELGILNWFNSLFLGVDSANPFTNNDVHYTFNTAFGIHSLLASYKSKVLVTVFILLEHYGLLLQVLFFFLQW